MGKFLEVLSTLGIVILMVVVIAAIISLPVMLLWDWLMPMLFGLGTITWVQSWGLLVLCSLLFKNNVNIKE